MSNYTHFYVGCRYPSMPWLERCFNYHNDLVGNYSLVFYVASFWMGKIKEMKAATSPCLYSTTVVLLNIVHNNTWLTANVLWCCQISKHFIVVLPVNNSLYWFVPQSQYCSFLWTRVRLQNRTDLLCDYKMRGKVHNPWTYHKWTCVWMI